MTESEQGLLVLAGTPIGDLADASPALAREIAAADVIAAEDTRRLRRLAGALGVEVTARVVSYFEGNEAARTGELGDALARGARVLLLTDAGMPSVSDPGYRLVSAAVEAGIRVTAVPGPSAVLTALAVSGLPVDRFCFEGFLPRRAGERARRLSMLSGEERTMVFFESRHRLAATVAAMVHAFGADRRAAVCRELTKTHEEIRRGPLGDLMSWVEGGAVLGEVTLVVAGAVAARPVPTVTQAAALVAQRESAGVPRKEAIAAVARESGLRRRDVYAAVVARPAEHNGSDTPDETTP
ncbi:MAG TPA: 16S rRNA (cytidine(1402)-2'-O)-methyltransferase [Jiangellaceae bacterium]|nr:16S rRNA (cytidine(1402)-2'-O)-methyltransferase [Jiangellaceae bacterium]